MARRIQTQTLTYSSNTGREQYVTGIMKQNDGVRIRNNKVQCMLILVWTDVPALKEYMKRCRAEINKARGYENIDRHSRRTDHLEVLGIIIL